MVWIWMIILKRRMHHEIAINAAVDDLPRHLKSPPPPQFITPLPSVDTKMGTPRRQWEKGSTPTKTHPPSPCTTRRSKRRRMRASKTLPPVIHYRHHSRSSIQWLYLRHCFVQAYLYQCHLSDTHTETQPAHQFLVESIEHLAGKISTVLDNALLDFSTATMCFDEKPFTQSRTPFQLITPTMIYPSLPPSTPLNISSEACRPYLTKKFLISAQTFNALMTKHKQSSLPLKIMDTLNLTLLSRSLATSTKCQQAIWVQLPTTCRLPPQ